MGRTARPRALAACAFLLLTGCGGDASEDAAPTNEDFDDITLPSSCEGVPLAQDCVEPRSNALRLDAEERLGFERITFDPDTMSILMRLRPGAELPDKISVGAPIYRARKDRKPFLAIVESIDRRGDEVRVRVRRANVREVFDRGRIRLDVDIQDDPDVPAETDDPVTQLPRQMLRDFETLIDRDCRSTIIDQRVSGFGQLDGGEGLPFAAEADILLDLSRCNAYLGGKLSAILTWNGIEPDVFEFTVGAAVGVELEVTAELDNIEFASNELTVIDTIGHEKRVLNLPDVNINVSGINIKFDPGVYAGVRFIAGGEVNAAAGFTYEASAEAGLGWAAGRGVYDIFETEKEFMRLGPTIEQDEDSFIRAWVRPQLDISVSGVLGGSLGLETYVELDSEGTGAFNASDEFEGSVCYDFDAGMQPVLGVEVTVPVINTTLVSETWRLKGIETNISDACLSTPVPPEPACGPADECAVDSDCLPANANACTVYNCLADCTCNSFQASGCCTTAADCDDGDASTQDICLVKAGSCLNKPIYGYCDTDAECNDGLVWTEDTCVDNRCQQQEVNPPDIAETAGPGVECISHTQCDDGIPFTEDSCVSGSCRNATDISEAADTVGCNDDIDCDDGVLFTEDTCQPNGTCLNENRMPGGGLP